MSPATPPFPQKLVDKVRSGQFVEMRVFLTDISLLQQLEIFGVQYSSPALPGMLKPCLQDVSHWRYFQKAIPVDGPRPPSLAVDDLTQGVNHGECALFSFICCKVAACHQLYWLLVDTSTG